MRWRRSCKRLMILLMFACMTIKLHLEFRLLDSTKSNTFSPWWTNETVGHLRGFPKNKLWSRGNSSSRGNAQKYVLIESQPVKVLEFGKGVQPDASILSGGKKSSSSDQSLSVVNVTDYEQLRLNVTTANSEILEDKNDKEHPREDGATAKANHNENEKGSNSQGDHVYSNRKLSNERPEAKITDPDQQKEVEGRMPSKDLPKDRPKEMILHPQVPKPKNVRPKEWEDPKSTANLGPIPVPVEGSKPKLGLPGSVPRHFHKSSAKKIVPKRGVSHDVDTEEMSLKPEMIKQIMKKMEILNDQQTIYNLDTYGPILRNTTVLLVQVHNRLENLRFLVESMKKASGINDSLVIFSHDYWYPAMNDFVTNITEFRVMQMFFPFSIQLHPHKFPGRDPKDCSWNSNRNDHGLKCLNKDWPDSYGHYREASFTQIKHHWWWKIHRVFNELRETREGYGGYVVFLEEDHYILPDLLYVLSKLQRERASHCASCQVLALGNYNKMSPNVYKNFVERGDWWVTKHNLGFALNAGTWQTLSMCKAHFCSFDDYNWDWTLNNIVQTCLKPRMAMLSVKFSRVLHVGSCGTHVKKKNCDVRKEIQNAKTRIDLGRQWIFPKHLSYQNVYRGSGRVKKGNGGWGDFRDRELCRAIANATASEETLKRLDMN